MTAADTAVQYFIRERLQKPDSAIQFMGEEQAAAAFRRMRAVYDHCHDIRRIGATSVELCWTDTWSTVSDHGILPQAS